MQNLNNKQVLKTKTYQTTNLDKIDLGKIPTKSLLTGKYRKYTFDESFFMKESPESAYFFGFALGDGCLSIRPENSKYQLSFQLNEKDHSILEQFCNWTSCSNKAIGITTKNLHQLRFNNKKLFTENDFSKWGLVCNKTINAVKPTIKNNINYFIIGLLDADGSISWNSNNNHSTNRIDLICNKLIIEWYIEAIKNLGFDGKITHFNPSNKSWARATIHRRKDIINLCNILDIQNCNFKLQRKWNKIIIE